MMIMKAIPPMQRINNTSGVIWLMACIFFFFKIIILAAFERVHRYEHFPQ